LHNPTSEKKRENKIKKLFDYLAICSYIYYMKNQNDSLSRTAHVFGMTDLEFEERSKIESEIAAQQVIRQWQEDEEADREALKKFSENEDFDYGFHDQWEF
jgi:hypothetical protein